MKDADTPTIRSQDLVNRFIVNPSDLVIDSRVIDRATQLHSLFRFQKKYKGVMRPATNSVAIDLSSNFFILSFPFSGSSIGPNIIHTVGLSNELPPAAQMEFCIVVDREWNTTSCEVNGVNIVEDIDTFICWIASAAKKHTRLTTENTVYHIDKKHILDKIVNVERRDLWDAWFNFSHVLFVKTIIRDDVWNEIRFVKPIFLYKEEVDRMKELGCYSMDVVGAFSKNDTIAWKLHATPRAPITEHLVKGNATDSPNVKLF